MKKVGFIDYFLDEWHAEKYPQWIEDAAAGRMKVTYAYGQKDSDTGIGNAEWCSKKGIQLLDTIEAVVDQSDYLVVLSPDNSEFHEALSMIPLQSGKPTFIDKTFAPDRGTALRMFEEADKYGTPMYSSSALRFSTEYVEAERQGIDTICSLGPGQYENYSIHQIEPIISLMGTEVKRLMYIGTSKSPSLLIQFSDGRQASIHLFAGDCPFSMMLNYNSSNCKLIRPESNFFGLFIENLVTFFETGKPTVNSSETITTITIIEFGMKAAKNPYQWIELP